MSISNHDTPQGAVDGPKAQRIKLNKIKIHIDYEGEEILERTLEVFVRYLGDDLCLLLRNRHQGADQIFTLGLHHEIDIQE